MSNIITLKLFKEQLEFVKDKHKEVLFSGGMGSGKSYSLCLKLVQSAMYPNSFCVLTRKSLASLKASTLRTLLVGEKDIGPVLPQGSYEYQESKSIIKVFGAGEIFVVGCDDPLRIRSVNASAIGIDECAQLNEDEYIELLSRIRNSSGNRQIFAATNPSSQNHFLYKRFFKEKNDSRNNITATLYSNKYLPIDYIKQQEQLKGVNYKRYVMAEWCNNEGAVYKEFNADLHLQEHDVNNYNKFIISCDIGFTDETAILVSGYNDNHCHIFEEIFNNKLTPTDICNTIKDLQEKYGVANIKSVVIDPSAKGTIVQAEQLNIPKIKKANNAIDEGIFRVKEYFIKNKLTISKKCVNLIRELDTYSYKDGTDKPEDKENHEVDSLRYNISELFDGKPKFITPTIFMPEEEREEEEV